MRTIPHHQSGVVTHPGVVVTGSEVGEGPHAVSEVEILLLLRHLHHQLQHGGQIVLSVFVPGEPPVIFITQSWVDMASAVCVA